MDQKRVSFATARELNEMRFGCCRCQLQIDPDRSTFGRTPQTIRTPICGLGTVTERNRKCLLQKDAVNLSSFADRQQWLADRRTAGKHRFIGETAAFNYRVDLRREWIARSSLGRQNEADRAADATRGR
jgi:hypothetical protein